VIVVFFRVDLPKFFRCVIRIAVEDFAAFCSACPEFKLTDEFSRRSRSGRNSIDADIYNK
jgi:hypothetical protein